MLKIAQLLMKTPAQGAATQCLLAASPAVDGISGKYWADCRIAEGNKLLDDKDLADRLWSSSASIIADAVGEL
jgi:WW domain-containing oxidoreductase